MHYHPRNSKKWKIQKKTKNRFSCMHALFSKEQIQLLNIYICIHKISYAFFYNFVHCLCILKNSIHICLFKKKKKRIVFFLYACIYKKNSFKHISYTHSKKNHAFINAFSYKKDSFKHTSYMHSKKISCIHKCIFSKIIHSNIHYICIPKNHAFINTFFHKKIFKHISYMKSQKFHTFINVFKKKSKIL